MKLKILKKMISKLTCRHILLMFVIDKFLIFSTILIKCIRSNQNIVSHKCVQIKFYPVKKKLYLKTRYTSKFQEHRVQAVVGIDRVTRIRVTRSTNFLNNSTDRHKISTKPTKLVSLNSEIPRNLLTRCRWNRERTNVSETIVRITCWTRVMKYRHHTYFFIFIRVTYIIV